MSFDVDDPVEEGEGPEDDGSAIKGPRRGPEFLDDGADGGAGEKRENQADAACLKQPAKLLAGGLVRTQVFTGHEPKDHGDERRDEVEGLVAAAIEDEGLLAREEVQEPLIEGRREVGAHVPVCPEAAEDLTGVIHAEGFVVRRRSSDRRERKGGPGGDGDDADSA